MNQKIQEIREKAKYWFAKNYNFSFQEIDSNLEQKFKDIIEEKFLELIVLECAEIVHDKNKVALMQRSKIYVFPEDIASHFGFHYEQQKNHY